MNDFFGKFIFNKLVFQNEWFLFMLEFKWFFLEEKMNDFLFKKFIFNKPVCFFKYEWFFWNFIFNKCVFINGFLECFSYFFTVNMFF